MNQRKLLTEIGEKGFVQERDGRLKNLLKKTYLKRWIGTLDSPGNEAETHLISEGNGSDRRSNYRKDFARMKIENATLKESLESMEHLTSAISRLRLTLLKVKDSFASEETIAGSLQALEDIVSEAKLLKTALGNSLPVSWLAEADVRSFGESLYEDPINVSGDSTSTEKVDFVSATGFEMVETLILAAQILKDHITKRGSREGS
ncbi:hypothetical protein U1Q18_035172 [Sarracenia purpurea var. burkii]